MKFFFNKNEMGHEVAEEIVMVRETLDIAGVETDQEIASVIALALKMYDESLQEEWQAVESIQNFMRIHSPWSSKNKCLRQQPFYMPSQRRTKA